MESVTPVRDGGKSATVDLFLNIQGVIAQERGKAGALIRILEKTQLMIGYLPRNVLMMIARELNVPLSTVFGVVSFYSFFTLVPRGKYTVSVCMGTACYVRGGDRILSGLEKELAIEPDGTTPDGKFSLGVVRCLGCCGLAPVVSVQDKVYRRMTPTKMKEALGTYV
jgi:NADP-reducing hydrogenase subunit HndA